MAARRFFDDADFQDQLVTLLTKDLLLLRNTGGLLDPEDFKPLQGVKNGRSRWIVAELALEHYKRYKQPIGRLLKASVLEYCAKINLNERVQQELEEYLKHLNKLPAVGPEAITDKIVTFKREKIKAHVISEMSQLASTGQLTDEKWYELSRQGIVALTGDEPSEDFFSGIEQRIKLRELEGQASSAPLFFIDPLDQLIKGIEPGGFGMLVAPTGKGKTTGLTWIAMAYALQRIPSLYFTLETPKRELENRMDAMVTGLPIKRLADMPKTTRKRFERYLRFIQAGIHIIDGTQGGMTVAKVEEIYLREREAGFHAGAVFVDYDDEVVPAKKHNERRFELAEVYRSMRQMWGRYGLLGWTGSQAKRGTENLKVINKDLVAEDISKINKVNLAIGIGKGDWGEDSKFLYVAKHNYDKSFVGCHIVGDLDRSLFYDREKTRERELEMNAQNDNEEV